MKKDDDIEYFLEQLAKGCEISAQLDYTPGEPQFGWKITVLGHGMICEMGLANVINALAQRASGAKTRSVTDIKEDILIRIGKLCGLKLVCVGQCESIEYPTQDDETENLYEEI